MNLYGILELLDANEFDELQKFSDFSKYYLDFIASGGLQADIISQNEPQYHFFQYREEGHFVTTRPINIDLFLTADEFDKSNADFVYSLMHIREIKDQIELRKNINRYVYTNQQCIGAALDAFNNSNKARKRNGDLFEQLIRQVISKAGVNVTAGEEFVSLSPLDENNKMKFQHDVILKDNNNVIKAIGQIKTSSKDRLDKIFLDKFMYYRLKGVEIPYFAIFLNDVQRKKFQKKANGLNLGINSTFLPGHFCAYSIALNPLNGVYYLDLRPNMKDGGFMSSHIKGFDSFIVEDMWNLLGFR